MANNSTLKICYLILLPYSPLHNVEEKGLLTSPKGAPYFYDNDIEVNSFPVKEINIGGISTMIKAQVLDKKVWVAECYYRINASGDEKTTLLNQQIQEELKNLFMRTMH